MGFLDNTTITVDAILKKKGREKLARNGDLNITHYAFADDEIDYGLYDVSHPNGSSYYGAVLENMPLFGSVEAILNALCQGSSSNVQFTFAILHAVDRSSAFIPTTLSRLPKL